MLAGGAGAVVTDVCVTTLITVVVLSLLLAGLLCALMQDSGPASHTHTVCVCVLVTGAGLAGYTVEVLDWCISICHDPEVVLIMDQIS